MSYNIIPGQFDLCVWFKKCSNTNETDSEGWHATIVENRLMRLNQIALHIC